MALGFTQGMAQQLGQRQEMALTQQMLESMEILQLAQLDLERRLDREVDENPALERTDLADESPEEPNPVDDDPGLDARFDGDAGDPGTAAADDFADGRDARVESDVEPPDDAAPPDPWADAAGPADESFSRFDDVDDNARFETWHDDDDFVPGRERGAPGSGGGGDDEAFDPAGQLAARGPTLAECLEEQLGEEDLPPRRRELARGIVHKLDPDGWLRVPLEETAPADQFPPPDAAELDAALAAVQALDPAGVGARDARECLALQLARRPEEDPEGVARRIVDGELENLAANRLPLIAKRLDCSIGDVKRGVALIRTCRPDPGADFAFAPVAAVRPDVRIVHDGDGLAVRLPGGTPRAAVSDMWLALFERTARARILRERFLADPVEGSAFRALRDKLRADAEAAKRYRALYDRASGLMKAVAMREQTLLRVTEAIVDAQQAYLRDDSDAPAPLSMQEIAQRVGYDESTISRTVKDKYAETPRGILPLRRFFVRGAVSEAAPAGGRGGPAEAPDAFSAQHVINRLRDLIEAENRKKPLRDNELQDRLGEEGFKLARRTVANYRAQLGYPSHTKRREY